MDEVTKKSSIKAIIVLHSSDNIVIAGRPLTAGEKISAGEQTITVLENLPTGHKVAYRSIQKNEKIIRWGVPIGSALRKITVGEHVHMHNMASDYIPSHQRNSSGSSNTEKS